MPTWPIQSDQHAFGYNKDKYNPAAKYHCIKAAILPTKSNNLPLAPKVGNQNGIGICGGFSWAELIYTVAKSIGQPVTEGFSEWWFYNLARWKEGTLTTDAGLTNDDVATMVAQFGCLVQHDWPWILPTNLNTEAPSSIRQLVAIKYPKFETIRVIDGIDGIKSALADGHCLIVGGPFFKDWENISSTGIAPLPTLDSLVGGGHDMLYIDYDDTEGGYVLVQNSWGTEYGKEGRMYIPYAAFEIMRQKGGYDCQYVKFDKSPLPIPTPEDPDPIPDPVPVDPNKSSCKVGNGIASALNIYSRLANRRGRFYYLNDYKL